MSSHITGIRLSLRISFFISRTILSVLHPVAQLPLSEIVILFFILSIGVAIITLILWLYDITTSVSLNLCHNFRFSELVQPDAEDDQY